MSRPPKRRLVKHRPRFFKFGPICNECTEVDTIEMTIDQLEAMRLADLECLSQEDAAESMKVSRQTFGRIIEQARKIVTDALINGKIIKIGCDEYIDFHSRELKCINCGHEWEDNSGFIPDNVYCPACGSKDIIKRKRCGQGCECPLKVQTPFI